MEDPPQTVRELLDRALAERNVSERAAALYIGVSSSALNLWRNAERVPDPESCRKIAAWAGYPEVFVLQLAGHVSEGLIDAPPPPRPPDVEIIPEIGVILRHYSPEEQRRYVLPMLDLVRVLREDSAASGPEPRREDTPGEAQKSPRRRRSPRR